MSIFKDIKKNYAILLAITFLTVVFSLALIMVQPLKYKATSELLIIQKQENVDAYSAVKSAEKIGKNLSEIMKTSSFMNKVLTSGFDINQSYFPKDEIELRKLWQKTLKSAVAPDTGILQIEVYHPQVSEAIKIAQAVSYVLVTQGSQYHGGGNNIVIKVVEDPYPSRFPAQPNIPITLGVGLAFGLILGLSIIYIFYSEKDNHNDLNFGE